MTSSRIPLARRPGMRAPGRAVVTTLRVCQKMPSCPDGKAVNTNWERFSRDRSRTRSIATPLHWQRITRISSTISACGGQAPSARAQNTRLVRGQLSRTLRIKPPSMGSRIRYGRWESASGFRATKKFTPIAYGPAGEVRWLRALPTSVGDVFLGWVPFATGVDRGGVAQW